MKNASSKNIASNITNYQAVNCNGKELGIVEGTISFNDKKETFIQLSTHYKDLFGNIKYAVPFNLCDIDHENKTIYLNVDKNELDFLYKIIDVYDQKYSIWDDELDKFFSFNMIKSTHSNNQNMNQ